MVENNYNNNIPEIIKFRVPLWSLKFFENGYDGSLDSNKKRKIHDFLKKFKIENNKIIIDKKNIIKECKFNDITDFLEICDCFNIDVIYTETKFPF